MKYLDEVEVLSSKYEKEGIKKGEIGTILSAEIRNTSFNVVFTDKNGYDYSNLSVHVADLKLTKSSNITDKDILEDLPKNDPNWWCKVENGFIFNLKGEKKNKIPYNYNS